MKECLGKHNVFERNILFLNVICDNKRKFEAMCYVMVKGTLGIIQMVSWHWKKVWESAIFRTKINFNKMQPVTTKEIWSNVICRKEFFWKCNVIHINNCFYNATYCGKGVFGAMWYVAAKAIFPGIHILSCWEESLRRFDSLHGNNIWHNKIHY